MDTTQARQAETIIAAMCETIAQATGEELFDTLTCCLGELFGVRCAFVGELLPGKDVRTLAVWAAGEAIDGSEYTLDVGLGKTIVHRGECVYPRGVRADFPDDRLLAEMEAEGCIGVTLRGDNGNTNGLLVVIDDHPMADMGVFRRVLDVAGARAGAELDRWRAEQTLRSRAERLDLALSVTNDGMYDWNIADGSVYFDARYYRMAGYEPGDFPSEFEQWACRVHPEDWPQTERAVKAYLAGETQKFDLEFRFRRKGGQYMWIRARVKIVERDAAGAPVRMIGTHSDITERKRIDVALRESEQRYSDIFNTSNDAVLIHDVETGRVLDVNDRMLEMYRCTRAQAKGMTLEAISVGVEPYTYANALKRINQVNREGPQVFEWLARRFDGERFWTEVALRRTVIAGKRRVLATVRDITERKSAETQRRRYEQIISGTGDLMSFVDNDMVYRAVNDAYIRAYQRKREEIIGRSVPELLGSELFERKIRKRLDRGLGGEQLHYESWFEFPGLGNRYAEVTYYPAIGDNHEVTGVVVCVHDITERKRAETEREQLEAQLRQSQKMEAIGQLAGGVAHDFNNLLQAILGYGEMAQNEAAPGSLSCGFLEEIMAAGRRAKMLVSQLLAFSRRQVLKMEDLELNDVIADLAKMIRRIIGEHITLTVLAGDALETVHADRGQISQIVTNLCVNSRDAMPDGGAITIETENIQLDAVYSRTHAWAEPGRYVAFRVTDTGCGMTQATLERVFEPFFTTKEQGKGTGLGLSTVYGLVKQHKGLIDVRSELGEGTTIRIFLPVVDRPAAPTAESFQVETPVGTETILLAEDDEMVRTVCKSMLESGGYTVLTARDGEDALRVFEEHADEIELAVLDVVMPKLSGLALCENIRTQRPKVRVLFSSGYSTDVLHADFDLGEGVMLIRKPYQRVDLLCKVREALDRQR